jgi:hypothetical protein
MADNDNIHDDIREINRTLTTMATSLGANAATLEAMNKRLFEPGGVIPGMWAEIKEVKNEAADALIHAQKANKKVDTQRAYVAGASAAGLAAGGLVKLALTKLGLHF